MSKKFLGLVPLDNYLSKIDNMIFDAGNSLQTLTEKNKKCEFADIIKIISTLENILTNMRLVSNTQKVHAELISLASEELQKEN